MPWFHFKTGSAWAHFEFISCTPESWKPVGNLPAAFHGQVPLRGERVPWRGDSAWQRDDLPAAKREAQTPRFPFV